MGGINFSDLNALTALQTTLAKAQKQELQKQADLDTAHDAAVAVEWAFHNTILDGKKQVVAQYGDNSE